MALFFRKVLTANADDIDIIGCTKRDVTDVFSAIEWEPTKMGLAVNVGQILYVLSTSRDVRHINSQITADNYTFDTVQEFIYLGSTDTIRITLANKSLCAIE